MNYVKTDDETIKQDELVDQFGVKVYVDPKAIFFIVGTEMDYVVSIPVASSIDYMTTPFIYLF
jgi:Fe-S cluster assembly iron-binding protein IscA